MYFCVLDSLLILSKYCIWGISVVGFGGFLKEMWRILEGNVKGFRFLLFNQEKYYIGFDMFFLFYLVLRGCLLRVLFLEFFFLIRFIF